MALSKLLGLEKRLGRELERLTRRKGTPREPLELIPEILDEVEKLAEPAGGGQRVLPFPRVVIRVRVAKGKRDVARAVFGHPPSLEERALERLREAGCETDGVQVKVEVIETSEPSGERDFDVHCTRGRSPAAGAEAAKAPPAGPARESSPPLMLEVVRGKTRRNVYELRLERINIGRLETVVDRGNRTMRHNDVAFLDRDDDVNGTISRMHAHIEFNAREGAFRLFDDGSAQGTRVIRDGHCHNVPSRAGRGVKLRHGDEVEVGRARLRFLTEWKSKGGEGELGPESEAVGKRRRPQGTDVEG